MRRVWIIGLAVIVVVVLVLAATAANNNQPKKEALFNYQFTMTDRIASGEGSTWYIPDSNNTFVVAKIRLINNASSTITFGAYDWLFSSQGKNFNISQRSFTSLIGFNQATYHVAPGDSYSFQLVFEVEKNVTHGIVAYYGPYVDHIRLDKNLIVPPSPTNIGVPEPISPLNGNSIPDGNITIRWTSIVNASFYEYEVIKDIGYGWHPFITGWMTTNTNDTFYCSYSDGHQAQWRVRAWSTWGQVVSDWSDWNAFLITLS